jgi:N-acyl-D-amino-acid deacylase
MLARFATLVMLCSLSRASAAAPDLDSRVRSALGAYRGGFAVAARNLATGESYALGGKDRVQTASVVKLPVMVEAFQQVKDGLLRLDERVSSTAENQVPGSGILRDLHAGLELTLEDAITLMIVESDNTATNVVLDRVGIPSVNLKMQQLGLVNTKIFKKVFKPLDRPPTPEEKEFGLGVTTPAEMVALLEKIERRQVVDAPSCEKMLAILRKQRDRDMIPRFLAAEPKVTFATKSGALEEVRNDVGLIYAPGATIALAAFAYRSPDRRWTADNEATLAVARVARALYTAWVPAAPTAPAVVPEYDLVVRNGRIVDGAGNPWFRGDVAVKDGRIARVGALGQAPARRVIDAGGRVVAPGFIDVHTHVETDLERIPTADNFVRDGVTTVITGNCGGSKPDLARYFGDLTSGGISLNLGSLIGHNTVRSAVMGTANRAATPEELDQMRRLVAQNMEAGAVGFSTGLIYIPGTYSTSDEVVELGKVAGGYGGVYASHMRDEGEKVLEAIEEALRVGREGRMPVELSHFKIDTRRLWGSSTQSLGLVEKARREGLEVTVDQYPYRASSTGLSMLIPSWALADGWEKIKARYEDPATRKKIAAEMLETLRRKGRKHLDYAVVARCRFDPSLEGKNIAEITRLRGRKGKLEEEIQTVIDLELQSAGQRIQMVYFSMSDEDVERIMRAPFTMVASDAGVVELGAGVPHPRAYGTNARSLSEYVRKRGVLRLEDAVRRMTSLPAQTFRLTGRGLVREGYWADLVIFDPEKIEDRATFEKPHQYAEGFQAVLVNGEPVVLDGSHTGAKPGKVLYGPGHTQP